MKKIKTSLYEGVYILRATLSDSARDEALRKLIALIEGFGGSREKVIDWGRKKFAYRINGCSEGYFYLIYFSLPTHKMHELVQENRLNEDLLRFMNIAVDQVPESDTVVFQQIMEIER